jgi:hypothetical protein
MNDVGRLNGKSSLQLTKRALSRAEKAAAHTNWAFVEAQSPIRTGQRRQAYADETLWIRASNLRRQ